MNKQQIKNELYNYIVDENLDDNDCVDLVNYFYDVYIEYSNQSQFLKLSDRHFAKRFETTLYDVIEWLINERI